MRKPHFWDAVTFAKVGTWSQADLILKVNFSTSQLFSYLWFLKHLPTSLTHSALWLMCVACLLMDPVSIIHLLHLFGCFHFFLQKNSHSLLDFFGRKPSLTPKQKQPLVCNKAFTSANWWGHRACIKHVPWKSHGHWTRPLPNWGFSRKCGLRELLERNPLIKSQGLQRWADELYCLCGLLRRTERARVVGWFR